MSETQAPAPVEERIVPKTPSNPNFNPNATLSQDEIKEALTSLQKKLDTPDLHPTEKREIQSAIDMANGHPDCDDILASAVKNTDQTTGAKQFGLSALGSIAAGAVNYAVPGAGGLIRGAKTVVGLKDTYDVGSEAYRLHQECTDQHGMLEAPVTPGVTNKKVASANRE